MDAILSPPYGVEIIHSTVRSIAVKWQPPIHVPPHQEILYTIYYQATNATGNVTEQDELPNTVTTMFTQLLLTNLTYDTQYKISVQARTPDGDKNSPISEVSLRRLSSEWRFAVALHSQPLWKPSCVQRLCEPSSHG